MIQVKNGDTIEVHYKGTLSDGTLFDSSIDSDPLKFKVGSGEVIEGFENGVLGMGIGEKKLVTIPPANAYGDFDDDKLIEVPISEFPENIVPELGMQLSLGDGQGNTFDVIVVEIRENVVVLNANHPLAGHELTFALELISINGQKSLIILP